MLAPMILPFQLMCVVIVILFVAVVLRPIGRSTRGQRFAWFLLGSPFLFVALLFAVEFLVDAVRYRTFQYAKGSDIRDRYVSVPKTATNVTVNKYASGHEARLSVPKAELLAWLEQERKDGQAYNATQLTEYDEADYERNPDLVRGEIDMRFGRLGWQFLPDLRRFHGPHSARGGGFTVYYSESQQIAYLKAAYW